MASQLNLNAFCCDNIPPGLWPLCSECFVIKDQKRRQMNSSWGKTRSDVMRQRLDNEELMSASWASDVSSSFQSGRNLRFDDL